MAEMNCSSETANNLTSSFTNCTSDGDADLAKAETLILIFIVSLVGNICTIAVVGRFRVKKVPDVLVIGLACTDLIATLIPVPMSIYSYLTLEDFSSAGCTFFATIAQFTRYSSVIIVTLISLERYFAVNRPFTYRKYATPLRFVKILFVCWLIAFILAIVPATGDHTNVLQHDGFCLFDFASNYSYAIIAFAGVQYVIVFVCFILVITNLIKVYHRRKKMRVRGNYNANSRAQARENGVSFTKPDLKSRISDLGKSLKHVAPIITEKFQLGVEAQFARMLFIVVALFYISWTTVVVLIIIVRFRCWIGGEDKCNQDGLDDVLFWGIRLSVISTALNPLLYGLLARQYRLAYAYVLRLWFSKCCWCIDPPLKDVFAASRTPGGELHGETRREAITRRRLDEAHYASHGRKSQTGSLWSHGTSGVPVLTRTTTHTNVSLHELDLLPHEYLTTILESSVADHSTYIPSAGELASTVIIPLQARDKHSSQPDLHQKMRSASVNDLLDQFLHDGELRRPPPGSHNPLFDVEREESIDRTGELADSESAIEFASRKVYKNPVYQLERVRRENVEVQQATSTTPSIERTPSDDGSTEMLLPLRGSNKISRDSPLLTGTSSFRPNESEGAVNTTTPHQSGRMEEEIAHRLEASKQATEDKQLSKAYEEFDNLLKDVSSDTRKRRIASSPSPMQVEAEVHDIRSSPTTELEPTPDHSSSTAATASTRGKRPVTVLTSSEHITSVQELKIKFETLSPTSPTPPDHVFVSSAGNSRRFSTNSDSGRESMVCDSELNGSAVTMETSAL